jgi:hypothetical protein
LTERVGKIEEQISTKLEARLQALEVKLGVKIDVVAAARYVSSRDVKRRYAKACRQSRSGGARRAHPSRWM